MIQPDRTRRQFLRGGGALVLGTVLVACSDDDPSADAGAEDATTTTGDAAGSDTTPPPGGGDETSTTTSAGRETTLTAADFAALGACVLTPQQTEGPFYLDDELVRRDITEGLDGHRLRVGFQVVDASCTPVPEAVVDLWHADVDGDYSGFADGQDDRGDGDGAAGTTFLRGTQVATAEGIVEFESVYPGWYPGRTVHVHVKVHVDGAEVFTGQLYFDDERSDEIFAEAPYSGRGDRDTRNDDDGIADGFDDNGTLFDLRDDGDGTLALAVLGVDLQGGGGGIRP